MAPTAPARREGITRALRVSLGLVCLALGGCSLSATPAPTHPPQPSGVVQQLLVRSLERALGRLDIERLKGQSVAVEVINQAGPETFIKEFVVTWLRARGVRVVTAAESPALRVKAFASALGLDTEETFIGIPAFQAPVLNLGIPEIALFKWQRNRSVAELRLYEFDAKSDAIVNAPPPGIGRSKFDKFKILLVFGFNVTDAEDHD